MRKSVKIWIIVAVCCLLVGTGIAVAAAARENFKLSKFDTAEFENKTYTVNDDFNSIDVGIVSDDVYVIYSNSNECKVECAESNNLKYSVEVNDGTLKIRYYDQRSWYEKIGIFWSDNSFGEMRIYLPKNVYNDLIISTVSGNINMPKDFTFKGAEFNTTSGNINTESQITDMLELETISGQVKACNINDGRVDVSTTSGEVYINNSKMQEFNISSVSGEVSLTNVISNGSLRIDTTSGTISLLKCDASDIQINTVSGDVVGSLLSNKQFKVNTVSGEVDVPNTTSETQRCKISTTSGNIDMKIEGENQSDIIKA